MCTINGIIKPWIYKTKRGNLHFLQKLGPLDKMLAHFSQGSGGRVNKKAGEGAARGSSEITFVLAKFSGRVIFMPFAARHAFACKDMMAGHLSCRQHFILHLLRRNSYVFLRHRMF